MSRPLRIAYDGAWYHVMNRGLARDPVFLKHEHCEAFLDLLFDIHNRYQVEIHAYCLMGNHYHLLIRTPNGNISRAMRHLDGVYTQRFNKSMKRDGPLFRGRFKAILVEADIYLLRLSRYIHLNPVKANLVNKPEQFAWSSYKFFMRGKEPHWLTTATTLSYFGNKMQRIKYAAFVKEGIDEEIDNFFARLKKIPILGTEAFVKTVSEKYLQEQHRIAEIPEHKSIIDKSHWDMDWLMECVTKFYDLCLHDIHSSKQGTGNNPRSMAIYLSYVYGQHSARNIAKAFQNINTRSITQTCKRFQIKLDENRKLSDELNAILELIKG